MKYVKAPIPTLCERKDTDYIEIGYPYISMRDGYMFKIFDANACEPVRFGIYRTGKKRWAISCLETGRLLFTGRPSMPRDMCVEQFKNRYFSPYCIMRSNFFDGQKQALFKNMKQEFQDAMKRYAKVAE